MRYVMRKRAFSLSDSFTIENEAGSAVYNVVGQVFTIGKKLSFQDLDGNELAHIEQKLLSWGPTYEIYHEGELCAVVKKHLFTFFSYAFTIDVPGPDDLEAKGNFIDTEYTFSRGGQMVAEASKRWFNWTETYGVDISDEQDQVLILASAVVIEMVCHENRR
jgi:uncharacterized protein YxjI